jgi:hypothetical protein
MRLARAAPELMKAYRASDVKHDALMGFTLNDDHAFHRKVYRAADKNPSAHYVRRLMTEKARILERQALPIRRAEGLRRCRREDEPQLHTHREAHRQHDFLLPRTRLSDGEKDGLASLAIADHAASIGMTSPKGAERRSVDAHRTG